MGRPVRPLGLRERCRLEWAGRFAPLPRPEKWVFLVGCYNSGTTLLHSLLASHPAIGSMPFEGQFHTDQLRLPQAEGLTRLWAIEPARFRLTEADGHEIDVDRIKRQWGAHYDDPERPVLLEKSPTNAARTRWLQRHFEDAHFIALVRNGYAVAEGIRRKAGHPVARGARQWAVSNEVMLDDLRRLDRAILVRYERLTTTPAAEIERLADFLAVDPAGFSPTDRVWRIFGRESRIRNMDARSLAALGRTDVADIEREAGAMLARLDYRAP